MRLWKISYVSVATAPDSIVEANVREICARSDTHNGRAAITGILTYHAGRFAQVLEGGEAELRALMERITSDPRHHSVKIIADGPLASRRYAEWSMAYRDPKSFVRDQLDDVLEQTALLADALQNTRH